MELEINLNLPSIKKRKFEENLTSLPQQPEIVPPPKRICQDLTIQSCDDENHHYIINLGSNLTPRYKILSLIGEGTFGKVAECWDRESKTIVAIKIIRSIRKYRDAAMIELEVLKCLKKNDPCNYKPVIHLESWFEFQNHVCMVFRKYGLSLFDFLKKNRYKPFSLAHVREFTRQLLDAVDYLHSLKLVHTDIKPENILLEDSSYKIEPYSTSSTIRIPNNSKIKLIDFGSAAFENQTHAALVSTRHYRAPEIILGLGWSYPCDMWSVGCIIVELYTGDALFQTHENLEHLALMEQTLASPIPSHMIEKCDQQAKKFFNSSHKLVWPENESQASINHVGNQISLKELLSPTTTEEKILFYDLVLRLLQYDPKKRLIAQEALQHPFLRDDTTTSSKQK